MEYVHVRGWRGYILDRCDQSGLLEGAHGEEEIAPSEMIEQDRGRLGRVRCQQVRVGLASEPKQTQVNSSQTNISIKDKLT